MKVTVDLDDALVAAVEARAVSLGLTVDEIVGSALSHLRPQSLAALALTEQVKRHVTGGRTDAWIGDRLGLPVGRIAGVRRSAGLKPNRNLR